MQRMPKCRTCVNTVNVQVQGTLTYRKRSHTEHAHAHWMREYWKNAQVQKMLTYRERSRTGRVHETHKSSERTKYRKRSREENAWAQQLHKYRARLSIRKAYEQETHKYRKRITNTGRTSGDRSTRATFSTYNTWIQLGRMHTIYSLQYPKLSK